MPMVRPGRTDRRRKAAGPENMVDQPDMWVGTFWLLRW